MILQDHLIEGLSNFTGKEPVKVTYHPARFGSYKHCGIGVLKQFVSLTMVAMEIGKKQIISVILHQKHKSFTFELPMIKLTWLEKYKATKNAAILKSYILSERIQKLKNIVTFHD